ncbi:hypothetical protein WPS_21560 [Vulcanimicrobium alpinum]|uniref:Peptidase S9 prolyl oligopeptidase catalytic domain-containing protein n=1 Tax=Vulcanimicrobium alpinum TaxID=3016050 RepID=A0AAN1XXS6_UNVUL|nr:prolyl oligopeptidase family serine peptidase [Vulcanimicrobium alpinum]BDE06880.1 hypothetical protein WPS_21560 [Vulcanimicrobium alpinum]
MQASRSVLVALLCAACSAPSFADATRYRTPPPPIEAALRAPAIPTLTASPNRAWIAERTPLRYPPVADLARPMLRLAGLRIDPATNGIHHASASTALAFVRVADGKHVAVALPPDARVTALVFSPDAAHFAFTNATARGTELWLGTTATGAAHRVAGLAVNDVFPNAVTWMPGGTSLLVRAVDRTGPPLQRSVAAGPAVQETAGGAGPIVTYEDLLADAADEALFTYYAASRLAFVSADGTRVARTAARGIFTRCIPSPRDGALVLTTRVHAPYSYLFPYQRFPLATEIYDVRGSRVATIADRPLADRVPADGVPAGPRDAMWLSSSRAEVAWIEALDGGDPNVTAAERDRIVARAATGGALHELARTAQRVAQISPLHADSRVLVETYDPLTRTNAVAAIDTRSPGSPPRALWSLRARDVYHDPGEPMTIVEPNGASAVLHAGDAIYLRGAGYGPEGQRPFLDRYDLATGTTTRLFRSELAPLESVGWILDDGASSLLTIRQLPADPPNAYVRARAGTLRALTAFGDPQPMLRGVGRRVVTYKRADGVDLSFTLYTPPGWHEGTRLPALLWAYPLEFVDRGTASQNVNSTQTFVNVTAGSPVFFALAGYAVLDNASMPIVGDPKTVNDTYIDQLTADAQAVVDTAVGMGVVDRDRIAVAGHSYGAFMTANLLAHTRLFRAGIACSGAYNRSLTPFGFQNETRTYWEATDLYTAMSPFTYANQLKDPLLLIHGEADDNTGTYPIQSQRFYAAIKGNGGTARLVMLPYEAHGYTGRESVETVLAEMLDWLDRYVKPPKAASAR